MSSEGRWTILRRRDWPAGTDTLLGAGASIPEADDKLEVIPVVPASALEAVERERDEALAFADDALEDTEAAFAKLYPSGERPSHLGSPATVRRAEAWDLLAQAIDHLRDVERAREAVPRGE